MRVWQDPTAIIIHPSGVEHTLHESIDAFGPCYGDKKGQKFRIWLDRMLTSQIASDAWLVKFDKWELDGKFYWFLLQTNFLSLYFLYDCSLLYIVGYFLFGVLFH